MNTLQGEELKRLYSDRFDHRKAYRNKVWQVLTNEFFCRWVQSGSVLDLGCGYGEFINNVTCSKKYAMDLNPRSRELLNANVQFLEQNCAETWNLDDECLDVIFTSNFFEHLPDKTTLAKVFDQAKRCLKPGGFLIAMGPNIKFLPGQYWDFWDHYLPLTELSMEEGLSHAGFKVTVTCPRFLPYTMVNAPEYPIFMLRTYLKLPFLWEFFGKQFLVVAQKP